jgi:hypothetical protein
VNAPGSRDQWTGHHNPGNLIGVFPSQSIVSIWVYELKMVGGTLFFLGAAWVLFYLYSGRGKAGTPRHVEISA